MDGPVRVVPKWLERLESQVYNPDRDCTLGQIRENCFRVCPSVQKLIEEVCIMPNRRWMPRHYVHEDLACFNNAIVESVAGNERNDGEEIRFSSGYMMDSGAFWLRSA